MNKKMNAIAARGNMAGMMLSEKQQKTELKNVDTLINYFVAATYLLMEGISKCYRSFYVILLL